MADVTIDVPCAYCGGTGVDGVSPYDGLPTTCLACWDSRTVAVAVAWRERAERTEARAEELAALRRVRAAAVDYREAERAWDEYAATHAASSLDLYDDMLDRRGELDAALDAAREHGRE